MTVHVLRYRGCVVRLQQVALPIGEVHKLVALEYQVDKSLDEAPTDCPRSVRSVAQQVVMSFGNRIGELHFADILQPPESAVEYGITERDSRSERVEHDFAATVQPSWIVNAVSAHRAREQFAHIVARHPGLQIGRIAE